jgi:UDP-N-acetylglucosamine 2-epimerase (non-hydrolysing)
LCVIPGVGYLDFLRLLQGTELVLTDSGGIQEEACCLKIACVTLRDNTERPETVRVGANKIAGVEPARVLKSAREMMRRKRNWKNPLGDGKAGLRIATILSKNLT